MRLARALAMQTLGLLTSIVQLAVLGAASPRPATQEALARTTEPQQALPLRRTSEGYAIPPAPSVPTGPATEQLEHDLEALFRAIDRTGIAAPESVDAVASHGDARTAWIFADVLRFARATGAETDALTRGIERVARLQLPANEWTAAWKTAIDFLIAWDLPALPNYHVYKERLFVRVEPGWAPFFDDAEAEIDWRTITWGGVLIDDRSRGSQEPCARGCIPALDDPAVTDAEGGAWYPGDEVVFGVTINGESRAYPKHQMETHELVNDTVGGRRIALPYCTLCGSAQAYFTDGQAASNDPLVLRTSGLLSRSNKVMYDLNSHSVFDTFTGRALSGPLREAGVRLEAVTVVTSTWSEWKAAHPDTTLLAQDGGIGRTYSFDPLGGRDDDGPIFPVGDVDPRLAPQHLVVGVELPSGRAFAFPADEAAAALDAGGTVQHEGVTLERDGSGVRARDAEGRDVPSHVAYWFAWSQFWPETELWRVSAASQR